MREKVLECHNRSAVAEEALLAGGYLGSNGVTPSRVVRKAHCDLHILIDRSCDRLVNTHLP